MSLHTFDNFWNIFHEYKSSDLNSIYKMILDWILQPVPLYIELEHYDLIMKTKLEILDRIELSNSSIERQNIVYDFIKGLKYINLRNTMFEIYIDKLLVNI